MRDLVDLSHTIFDGLVTYRGLPAPTICDFWSREATRARYAPGTEFQIAKIEMVANTGTYLDTPFHRYAEGDDLSQIALPRCAELPGLVIRADYRDGREIGPDHVTGRDVAGKAVLVHTGWDRHWNTDAYFEDSPYLTEAAAVLLRDAGAALVGIDSLNIDDPRGDTRPVHTVLLGAGILIVEHLCRLGELPDDDFLFSAVPPKFRGVGTFPVRAMASIPR
ncbi:MAG: cyclase family protein [Gammaproteobacteria bacterium]